MLIFFHFAGDLDTSIHSIAMHLDHFHTKSLADGTVLFAAAPRHGCASEELSAIPGVTLLPHPHSPKKLGGCADLLKGMTKAPSSTNTMYEALEMLGAGGLFSAT